MLAVRARSRVRLASRAPALASARARPASRCSLGRRRRSGCAAEAVGVATGVPFGQYAYAGTLGPQLLGVPLLVPLAWTMMAYPALLAAPAARAGAAAPGGRRWRCSGGGTLAAWDLFLDPQMVAAGHWTWAHPAPSLPGVPDVPLTNSAGWLLVGTPDDRAARPRCSAARARRPREALPAALLAWTWLGSVRRATSSSSAAPGSALSAAIGMALLVVPYLRAGRRGARAVTAARSA